MMTYKKAQRLFFWLAILAGLILSAGHISATARTDAADLVINEFVAANGMGLADEDGDRSDWIEIYNQGDSALNLAGYALTDDPDQPQKWMFPDLSLGKGQYLVVFASGKNRQTAQIGAALHTNFKISKQGGFLALYSLLEGRFIDMVSPQFPTQLQDISFGRYGDTMNFGYLARPTPGGLNDDTEAWAGITAPVEFSPPPGFYDGPITVKLASAMPDAVIQYTTDSSQPTEINGAPYTGPITIQKTTLLRAVAIKPNYLSSNLTTQSYIFLDEVMAQPAHPADFPANWDTQFIESQGYTLVSPLSGHYNLNSDIVNDPRYHNNFKYSLKSLPVVSLVLDKKHLAHLLVKPDQNDRVDEHPVSIEMIDPNTHQPGFQINAGIKPLWSPTASKTSFKLVFKNDYGPTKLNYHLFSDSPIDNFDTLVLQAALPSDPAAYTRDEWLRSTQQVMSGLAARGLFVHVYLNGLYWGVYSLTEKPDASFMAAHYGDKKEDWFIANPNGPLSQNSNQAADRLNYLFTILSFTEQATPISQQLPISQAGDAYAAVASYLDPAQFSDALILNWYAASLDWPAPNWHAAIHLQDTGGRGQGKLLFWNDPGTQAMPGDTAPDRIIQRLFEQLRHNPDFKVQLADRMYLHLQNDGPLSDSQAQARWLSLNETITQAIIAESARWGNLNPEQPLTPDNWRQAGDEVKQRMAGAAARLISLGREADFYPPLDPPTFSQPGGLVETGFSLTMSLSPLSQNGVIYYTTDGSDPRMPITGQVGPTAVVYNGPVTLNENATVKARVMTGTDQPTWSALQQADFNVVEQDYKLRLTEVMYNPLEGDDYEFIELKNMGHNFIALAIAAVSEGVTFIFPTDTLPLAPGQTAVLVSNAAAFARRYPGVPISGVYDGHLSNKGEKIVLLDANGTVMLEFTYNDDSGWPISADGHGDSLVLANTSGNPNDPKNWRASIQLGGSPGTDEPTVGLDSQ
jgi:hypothetical protein